LALKPSAVYVNDESSFPVRSSQSGFFTLSHLTTSLQAGSARGCAGGVPARSSFQRLGRPSRGLWVPFVAAIWPLGTTLTRFAG
jgi:hypothetical protein